MYKLFFKRLIDFVLATIGFIVLSPIFLLLMVCLFIANKGSPFFFQQRPGKDEKLFNIIKFKSMNDERDSNGELLADTDRLTKVGAFVRKTSLDEIPQLINVIKGDMSLVGPRPLLIQYLPYYTEREKLRHAVRPGITGLAQVMGRNSVTWDEKLEFDAEYVQTLSFWGDMKIIYHTILGVLRRKDVNTIPSQYGVLLSFARENECVLRPLREEDLQFRVDWINDPRIHETMNISTPISLAGTKEWFKRNQENKSRGDFTLLWNGTPIAMTGVSGNDNIIESYTFVNPDLKGRGFGILAQFLRLVYVFDVLNFKEVKAIVDSNNLVSRHVVEKLGFKCVKKVEAEIVKHGKSVDRYHYICSRSDFNRDLYGYTIGNGVIEYPHKRSQGTSAPDFQK